MADTENPEKETAHSYPPVPDDRDTYRMLLRPKDILTDGTISFKAFQLRPADFGCLSVALPGQRTAQQVFDEEPLNFNDCFGIGHLTAGQYRLPIEDWATLEVEQDEEHHACTNGFPLPPESNDVNTPQGREAKAEMERVGIVVSKRAKLVWTKP